MKKLVSLLAATALLATAVATPANARSSEACDDDSYSGAWFCATVKVPDSVTLGRKDRVEVDVTVDYTASGAFYVDSGNYIHVTSEKTGYTWTFDLGMKTSSREGVTLTLAPDLATGRYWIDLSASAEVDYYDDYFGYDDEWLWIYESNVTYFDVKPAGAPKPKSASKSYMKLSTSAKKVGYGKKVTLKGSVAYGGSRKPLKSKTLTVFFDPDGDERGEKKVGTVKTNSKGQFSKAFKQKVPGKWTVKWKGNSTAKKVSKSISTKVKPTKYKSCKALNKDYPGGVAKSTSAAWKGWEKREPFVFKALYTKNKKLDRDKDGVACER